MIVDEYTTLEIACKLMLSHENVMSLRNALLFKMKACNAAVLIKRAYEYDVLVLHHLRKKKLLLA